MGATDVVVGHAAGWPVEEVVSLALTAGGMASAGVRIAWRRVRSARRRPERETTVAAGGTVVA